MTSLWLLLGIDRLGFGGGIRPGLRVIATALAILIAAGATWGHPWPLIAVNVLGLLLLMTPPHGPMLTLPITQRQDGTVDRLYTVVAWVKNDELRWWAYSLIRYPGYASAWAAGRFLAHSPHWYAPILGAFAIPICYRVLWPMRASLPQFNKPGDQVESWTELMAWSVLGAAMALADQALS